MARERTVVKGIVLRAVDTKESDKILTVLTPGGKLPVVAKGARSRKSRVTACTQLLAYSELTLTEAWTVPALLFRISRSTPRPRGCPAPAPEEQGDGLHPAAGLLRANPQ